jgi:hypothetical protein
MEHFWRSIPGFFTFPEFYAHTAETLCRASPAPHCVEVGCYAGQSAACLGVELLRFARGLPRLDLVDLFNAPYGVEAVRAHLEPLAGVLGELHQGCSWDLASRYSDGTLDFVFIDADHSGEAVGRDIDAWRPKVRPGGILAGHDFTTYFPGLCDAVVERFADFHVYRGERYLGDANMQGRYWPVWSVQL